MGTGSIDLDRGSLQVQIQTGSVIDPVFHLLTPVMVVLFGTGLTAQNQLFDSTEYVTSTWDGSHWYDSQWGGSHWYGSHWYGSHWYGSHWYDTSWYGSHWYGIAWE